MSESNNTNSTKKTTHSNEKSIVLNVFEKIIPTDEKLEKNLQSHLQISPSISVNDDDDDDDDEEEDYDEDEFKCEECGTVQGLNNCELCDAENVCEECYGQGGDYGPNEIWVCHECLPTCNECNKKLYTSFDKCCGKGRSDDDIDDDYNK